MVEYEYGYFDPYDDITMVRRIKKQAKREGNDGTNSE